MISSFEQKFLYRGEFQITNHAEAHWKRNLTRGSIHNRHGKTSLGYFQGASGFVGDVSTRSLAVSGDFDVSRMEKAFCRIDNKSTYSGGILEDACLESIFGIGSEGFWFSPGWIPLRGVYWANISRTLATWLYSGRTPGASYTYHILGVYKTYSSRMLAAH